MDSGSTLCVLCEKINVANQGSDFGFTQRPKQDAEFAEMDFRQHLCVLCEENIMLLIKGRTWFHAETANKTQCSQRIDFQAAPSAFLRGKQNGVIQE
jgi:hypothetical protein